MGTVRPLRPEPSPSDLDLAAEAAAEILACLQARPTWNWLLRRNGAVHHAQVSSPDYVPLREGMSFCGLGRSPGEALREARQAADRAGTNAVRPDWDG